MTRLARVEAQLEALTDAVLVLANSRGLDPGHVAQIIDDYTTARLTADMKENEK